MEVQFRKFKGEVVAVFPYEIETHSTVMCYAHLGQHSTCHISINAFSKPATEVEYQDLKEELESIGYVVTVIKRINPNKRHKAFLEYLNNRK